MGDLGFISGVRKSRDRNRRRLPILVRSLKGRISLSQPLAIGRSVQNVRGSRVISTATGVQK